MCVLSSPPLGAGVQTYFRRRDSGDRRFGQGLSWHLGPKVSSCKGCSVASALFSFSNSSLKLRYDLCAITLTLPECAPYGFEVKLCNSHLTPITFSCLLCLFWGALSLVLCGILSS